MYKRFIFVIYFAFAICSVAFTQVSDELKQELINLYSLYAQSKTWVERLQYIRNPESYREIFESRYGNRDISFTPIRFGKCARAISSENIEVYALEEYVVANQRGRSIEIIQYRWFVRTGDVFKIDWEASVCYNPIPFARFKALQDDQIATMRCLVLLTTSSYNRLV
jgi:hypothetical protein